MIEWSRAKPFLEREAYIFISQLWSGDGYAVIPMRIKKNNRESVVCVCVGLYKIIKKKRKESINS